VQGFEAKIQAIQSAAAAEEWATARQLATSLVQTYPQQAQAWLWMAWLSEDTKTALGYAQRAATLDPALGKPAVAWVEERIRAEQEPTPPPQPLYTRKAKPQRKLGVWLMQGAALLATTGIVAMSTFVWNGGMTLPTLTASATTGHYANLPVNLDRPNDPALNQVRAPTPANRAITISMEPTATSILASPTPIFLPTPTFVPEPDMAISGGDAIPPPVVPTATVQPIDTRDLLFPVWPNRYEPVIYRVQAGDNLTTIAARCGLSPWTLIWANDQTEGSPELLTIGQELWIPPMDGVLHEVKPGDTLQGLAALYKVDPNIIAWFEGNDLEGTGGQLVAGQRLMVPGGVKPVEDLPPAPAAPTTRGGASYFGWPTTGVITQSYGSYHGGIDIANSSKTPIFAAQSGEVVYAGWDNSGYGYMIMIDHHNGWRTRYAHLSGMYPKVGDWVSRGDLIALMGSTGNSTGPHLHFEIITRGYRFNPMTYLPR
jgi:murein DD-endopeptidase MepM/ murein hydrolase activator NlpD